jgi:hypothetical protein
MLSHCDTSDYDGLETTGVKKILTGMEAQDGGPGDSDDSPPDQVFPVSFDHPFIHTTIGMMEIKHLCVRRSRVGDHSLEFLRNVLWEKNLK